MFRSVFLNANKFEDIMNAVKVCFEFWMANENMKIRFYLTVKEEKKKKNAFQIISVIKFTTTTNLTMNKKMFY